MKGEGLLEDGEVYRAILSVFHEARMLREVVLLAVLEDEYAVFFQQRQHKVGYGVKCRQGIRRVCEDEVKLPFAALQETENITLY